MLEIKYLSNMMEKFRTQNLNGFIKTRNLEFYLKTYSFIKD